MYGFENDEFKKRQDELQKMKFEMDGLEKSFSEMPGIKFGTYDVTGRHNPNPNTTLGTYDLTGKNNKNPDTTLGITDFSSAFKIGGDSSSIAGGDTGGDTVGSIYESFQPEDINLKSELPSENASGGLDFLGSKGTDVASTSVAAGMKALTMSQTTANNDGESVMNGIDMTMKGAQAGMAIGGPWGAAIGGAVGLGYGIYDGFADANKRGRNERKANKEKFNENRLRREQEFRISEGEESLKKLSALRKSQMDYLI